MEDAQRQYLVDAIRGASPCLDPDDLAPSVAKTVGLEDRDVAAIVWMLVSMFLSSEDKALDDFVSDVCQAAQESSREDLRAPRGDWDTFKAHLKSLLECRDSIGVTARALDVRAQYGHLFRAARILTDMRPVFKPGSLGEAPAGTVMHSLKITYLEGGESKEFYTAMDASDLRELREVIERAVQKESSLKSSLSKTDMQFLEVQSH